MEPMMPGRTVNQVILLGRLAEPPTPVPDVGEACQMVLTTEERGRDAAGEPITRLERHLLLIEEPGLTAFCLQHLQVGMTLYVEGSLRRNENPATDSIPVAVWVRRLMVASWDPGGLPDDPPV